MSGSPFPTVATLPISAIRRERVSDELRVEFLKRAIGRKALRVITLEQEPSRAARGEFAKIGVSHIVDKIWFVDDPPGANTVYAWQGVGTSYGMSMAEAETRAVIDKLCTAASINNSPNYRNRFGPNEFEAGARILRDNSFEPTVVITNVHDFTQLWHFPGFVEGIAPDTVLHTSRADVPVYYSRVVPETLTLLIDRGRAGSLVLKKDLTVSIDEIPESEWDSVSRAVPELSRDQLREKVKLLVEEVFRVDIDQAAAVVKVERTA